METKRNPKLLKLTLIAIAVCVALLVILFFGTPRFPKETRLCGQDLSGKTFTAPLPSSVRRILQGEHLTGEGL